MFEATEGRWGSREIEITDVTLLDHSGEPSFVFHSGDAMSVRVTVNAHAPISDFVFGIGLFNAEGVCCYGTNTYLEEMTPVSIEGTVQATFAIDRLDLVEGTYKLDVAVHKRDGFPYDYHRLLYTFRVKSRTHDAGIYRPPHRWAFSGAVDVHRRHRQALRRHVSSARRSVGIHEAASGTSCPRTWSGRRHRTSRCRF